VSEIVEGIPEKLEANEEVKSPSRRRFREEIKVESESESQSISVEVPKLNQVLSEMNCV
jgi:hypothetical protein